MTTKAHVLSGSDTIAMLALRSRALRRAAFAVSSTEWLTNTVAGRACSRTALAETVSAVPEDLAGIALHEGFGLMGVNADLGRKDKSIEYLRMFAGST